VGVPQKFARRILPRNLHSTNCAVCVLIKSRRRAPSNTQHELALLSRLVREHLIASPSARRDRGSRGSQIAWLIFYYLITIGWLSVFLASPNKLLGAGLIALALVYIFGKIWPRIYRWTVRLLAEALVGVEPGGRLRWLAFFLFLNGFFLDLITS
jgi:hypothetical protein